jgi:4-amino-4-deoxy-L-arabinose transferase-like glycosyltransferase
MSPETKRLKLSGIVALIAGCVCVVAGIVFAVLGVDITDLFVVAASVVALLVGARGARVANVPSNAPKLMGPSAGATVATGALCAGDVAFANGQVAPIVVGVVAFALALLVTISTAAVKKSVEKV